MQKVSSDVRELEYIKLSKQAKKSNKSDYIKVNNTKYENYNDNTLKTITFSCIADLKEVQSFRRQYLQALTSVLMESPFFAVTYFEQTSPPGEITLKRVNQKCQLINKFERSTYRIIIVQEDEHDVVVSIKHSHVFSDYVNGRYVEQKKFNELYQKRVNVLKKQWTKTICEKVFANSTSKLCCCQDF